MPMYRETRLVAPDGRKLVPQVAGEPKAVHQEVVVRALAVPTDEVRLGIDLDVAVLEIAQEVTDGRLGNLR